MFVSRLFSNGSEGLLECRRFQCCCECEFYEGSFLYRTQIYNEWVVSRETTENLNFYESTALYV